jgi:hypothetical protein
MLGGALGPPAMLFTVWNLVGWSRVPRSAAATLAASSDCYFSIGTSTRFPHSVHEPS